MLQPQYPVGNVDKGAMGSECAVCPRLFDTPAAVHVLSADEPLGLVPMSDFISHGESSLAITAIPEMAHYCFHVLECHFKGIPPMPAPAAVANEAAAAFTGWYNKGQLRGCIGSLSPCPLHDNLRGRALDAALNDTRYPGVSGRWCLSGIVVCRGGSGWPHKGRQSNLDFPKQNVI